MVRLTEEGDASAALTATRGDDCEIVAVPTDQRDMVVLARTLVAKSPDIGALMFECTGFQPFARSV